ncbi:hypothetical protein Q5P01_005235 [Channa striata]|uniref:Uncharacterized protein n=1 Tax=Channa striata TaxID=64152 RepID=A0AA88NND6_CHASR|nr:hypothetical protein Q5P01_005235 [Channa striata]
MHNGTSGRNRNLMHAKPKRSPGVMDLISEQRFLLLRPMIDALLRHRHLSGDCLFKLRALRLKAGQSVSVGEILGPIISCAELAELRDARSVSRRKEDRCLPLHRASLLITSSSPASALAAPGLYPSGIISLHEKV